MIASFMCIVYGSNQDTFYGVSYIKNGGKYLEGTKLNNIEVNITEDNINGSFIEGSNKVMFNSKKVNAIEKEQIVVDNYTGTTTINDVDYLIQISKNENGFSGMIFNGKKEVKKAFIISSQPILSLNKEFGKVNKQLKGEKLIKIKEENDSSNGDVGVLSHYYDKTLHIYKDAKDTECLISGGTVEGTLYYTRAANDPEGMTYYFDKVYGFVAWGTPVKPDKSITTWDVNYQAYYTSPYYFQATVSYTALVKNLPVLYWDNDAYLIN